VDLNSDLGEGYGEWRMADDEAMLGIVTSANVACGFHAGDPATMRRVTQSAVERGVAIGAHVSYLDLRGFGRRHVVVSAEELTADILYQIGALAAMARACGAALSYVKPHGALYNEMAVDDELADTVTTAIALCRSSLPLLVQPGSAGERAAHRIGLPSFREGFADRAYEPDGRLVARNQPGAVLTNPEEVAVRAVEMAQQKTVTAIDGSSIALEVDSICVHGDTPGAVAIAARVRQALHEAGVAVDSFATMTS
jgi:UPF0271 protein